LDSTTIGRPEEGAFVDGRTCDGKPCAVRYFALRRGVITNEAVAAGILVRGYRLTDLSATGATCPRSTEDFLWKAATGLGGGPRSRALLMARTLLVARTHNASR